MSAVRVLVTGSAGQVGVDLTDTLVGLTPLGGDGQFQPDREKVQDGEFDVVGLTRHDLDVTNRDAVFRAFQAARPDVVVNLAAYTAVDRAEIEVPECYAVNAIAVESFSQAAREVDAHLITISTDYVFDGEKASAYVEDDAMNPLNVYGASKRAGELTCTSRDTIVRTSWVMGARGKNVMRLIAARARSGEHVRFVDDQMGTVTLASDLARALVTLVRERPGGVWHVANTGATTWFELARFAGQSLGRDDHFATPIATSDLDPAPLAARPPRSDLDTKKWSAQGWLALPAWQRGVERLLDACAREELQP
ncbi:MAG: dTDP-4-dehydrorhamnose reductase [Acidimicrobiales bacterium]